MKKIIKTFETKHFQWHVGLKAGLFHLKPGHNRTDYFLFSVSFVRYESRKYEKVQNSIVITLPGVQFSVGHIRRIKDIQGE